MRPGWVQTLLRPANAIIGTIVIAAALFGGYVTYIQPHVTVSVRDESVTAQPFATIFSVISEADVNIYDIAIVCHSNHMRFSDGGDLTNYNDESVPNERTLQPGESTDIRPCGIKTDDNYIQAADFDLSVSFRPQFWLTQKTQVFHFRTERQGQHLIWLRNAQGGKKIAY